MLSSYKWLHVYPGVWGSEYSNCETDGRFDENEARRSTTILGADITARATGGSCRDLGACDSGAVLLCHLFLDGRSVYASLEYRYVPDQVPEFAGSLPLLTLKLLLV